MVSSTVDPGVVAGDGSTGRDRWLRRTAVSWAIGLIASLLMLYYSYKPSGTQGIPRDLPQRCWRDMAHPDDARGHRSAPRLPAPPAAALALYEHGIGVGECFIAFVDLARIECDRRIELSFRSKYDFDNYVTEWRFHGKDGSIAEYVVRYSRRKDPFVEMDDFNDALRAAGIRARAQRAEIVAAIARLGESGRHRQSFFIITAVVLGIQWAWDFAEFRRRFEEQRLISFGAKSGSDS